MGKWVLSALALTVGLGSIPAHAAIITQLNDFSEFTSPVIISATGNLINDSPDFSTNGLDCFNVGIGNEVGVCAIHPDPLTFDIARAFEVGMLFGNDDPNFGPFFTAVLTVFDGPMLLGSVSLLSNGNDLVDQFIGLRSDVLFDHVELQYVGIPEPTTATRLVTRVDFGTPVPEPGTVALFGLGLLLGWARRRPRP
jgi:hypothetical protein